MKATGCNHVPIYLEGMSTTGGNDVRVSKKQQPPKEVQAFTAECLDLVVSSRMDTLFKRTRNAMWKELGKCESRDYEFYVDCAVSDETILKLVKELRDKGFWAKAFDRHGVPIGCSMFPCGSFTTLLHNMGEAFQDVAKPSPPAPHEEEEVAPVPIKVEAELSSRPEVPSEGTSGPPTGETFGSEDEQKADLNKTKKKRRAGKKCITIHVPTKKEREKLKDNWTIDLSNPMTLFKIILVLFVLWRFF